MSSASSPNPQNLLMLAALGIGAYWLMTRRALAAQPVGILQPGSSKASNAMAFGNLVGTVANLFRGTSAPNLMGTVDGRSATQWDVTPQGAGGPAYNNPSAYVSGGADGIAANPVNTSPYDFSQENWY